MNTRRSVKKLDSIHLTEVKSNSTCQSLKLPLSLACDRCASKIDVTISSRKKGNIHGKFQKEIHVPNIGMTNGLVLCTLLQQESNYIIELETI